MKAILATSLLLFLLSFNQVPKTYRIEYGDTNYMYIDTLCSDYSDIVFEFKDSLPDGDYLAYDSTFTYNFTEEGKFVTEPRFFLKYKASFRDGQKHGIWIKWFDEGIMEEKTILENGFYKYMITYDLDMSQDTLFYNGYPDMAVNSGDWNFSKWYIDNKPYRIFQRIDSNQTTIKNFDDSGILVSYAHLYQSRDSFYRTDYAATGKVKGILHSLSKTDSIWICDFDTTGKIIFEGIIE